MSSTSLYRLSGLSLLIALTILIAGNLIHPPGEEVQYVLEATYGPAHIIEVVAWILILLGLPGLYARQADRAGKLGLVSFVLLMIAAAYHFYLLLYEAFATPILAKDESARHLVGPGGEMAHGVETVAMIFMPVVIAFPLFGIATLRAGIFPRWSGWLQIAAVPAWILSAIVFSVMPSSVEDTLMAPVNLGPVTLMYTILAIGYAAAGYTLWTEYRAGVVNARPVMPEAAA